MSKSETSWYREGSISLITGSKEVTGDKTYWEASGIKPGDMLTIDNGSSFLEIDSITDNDNLLLRSTYSGISLDNVAYAVVRNFNATMSASVAAKQAELLVFIKKYITDKNELIGKSAYDVAVENGFNGSEKDWLESLKGAGEIYSLESRADALEEKIIEVGELEELDTEAKGTIVEAINEIVANTGVLDELATEAKDNIVAAINEIVANTGALDDLSTTAKSNIVAAVNETKSTADLNTQHIGTMETLKTAVKTTIIAAINEVFDSLATTSATVTANSTKLSGIEAGANKYVHPSYTARTGAETSNQAPAFGGTFNLSQVSSDTTGHVSNMTTRTVTIPSSLATTSAAGLMSAADKSTLASLASIITEAGGDGLDNAGVHNSFYRGKYLGTSFTAAQKSAIANGNFDNMYVGDYWMFTGNYSYNGNSYPANVKLRIAGFDCQMYRGYWYQAGKHIKDYLTRNHHVVIVPDTVLYQGTGDSPVSTNLQGQALFETVFGASYLEPMAQSAYSQRKAELMSCEMVLGYQFNISNDEESESSCKRQSTQLPLFSLNPGKIPAGSAGNDTAYWLNNLITIYPENMQSPDDVIEKRLFINKDNLLFLLTHTSTRGYRPYCLIRGVTTDTFQEYYTS